MTAIQQALLRAGVVDKDAVDWAQVRDGKTPRVQVPSLADARRRWLVEDAKIVLLRDPTSEAARQLIREARMRFDDESDEFRRLLRPLYGLREQLDQTTRAAREQLIRRTL